MVYFPIEHFTLIRTPKTSLYSADPRDIDYIENVKELIYDHGSVSVIISSYLQINENHAVYNADGGGGHSVTIR